MERFYINGIPGIFYKIIVCNAVADDCFYVRESDIAVIVSPLNKLFLDVYLAPDVFARIEARCAYESARIDKKFHL